MRRVARYARSILPRIMSAWGRTDSSQNDDIEMTRRGDRTTQPSARLGLQPWMMAFGDAFVGTQRPGLCRSDLAHGQSVC